MNGPCRTSARVPVTSTRSRPRPSTSCEHSRPSGCAGRCGTPTTTCPSTAPSFDAAGVHPDDVKSSWRTWRCCRSPRRQTCATTTRSGCSPCRANEVARIHASSGTTGKPTVVGYTARDLDMWADVVARSIRAAGGRAGHILHNAYGYGLFTGGLGAHAGAEKLGCTVVPVSGGMTERQVQLITDFQPGHHHGHAVLHARRSSTRWSARASTRARRR